MVQHGSTLPFLWLGKLASTLSPLWPLKFNIVLINLNISGIKIQYDAYSILDQFMYLVELFQHFIIFLQIVDNVAVW